MSKNVSTADDVREWGRDNGFTVSARGRLSKELVEAYNAGTNASRGGRSKYVFEPRVPANA